MFGLVVFEMLAGRTAETCWDAATAGNVAIVMADAMQARARWKGAVGVVGVLALGAVGGALARFESKPTASATSATPSASVPPPPEPAPQAVDGMVGLTGGTYAMGNWDEHADQRPRYDTVTVKPFLLDLTEVTADAYAACVKAGGCTDDHPRQLTLDGTQFFPGADCNYGVKGRGNHPMNCVSWDQATAFCQWNKKRLPTEEEWQWAARGQAAATIYPWGNAEPAGQACWNAKGIDPRERKGESTCPVGSYPAGDAPGGIHDLAGNVLEWTATSFDAAAQARVSRGGGWYTSYPPDLRAASRERSTPSSRDAGLGFRCAR